VVRRPASLSLSIVDDGRGFDTATLAAAAVGHLGVVGMQERVRARGGGFRLSSHPGSGTSVEVEMPVT
jgi:signal transduction histidine kinase